MGKIIDRVRAQKQFAEYNRWEGVKSPGAIKHVYEPVERRPHDPVMSAKVIGLGALVGLAACAVIAFADLVLGVLR